MADVILTDTSGNAIGTADILAAHGGSGMLHKAFSVYVFDESREQMLIQRRSTGKMLWAGIWANSCCSHPRQGETPVVAGRRRLQEEFGFTCDLQEGPSYVYRAEDPIGRGVEHEYVTTLIGIPSPAPVPVPDPQEIAEWKWMNIGELQEDMSTQPDHYAPWFHIGLPKVLAAFQ